ncbi:MAG TPA: bL33 family ribosomal protein, partial [Gammaproteobacteria bacterium]|nr:bL33 family ribosomal protein [Gammaproteobacteria bacterium]
KNKTNTPDKLARKKYDPLAWNKDTQKCGMHVDFKEKKIPK